MKSIRYEAQRSTERELNAERTAREQAEAQRDTLLDAIRSFREARAARQRHDTKSSPRLEDATVALFDKADSFAVFPAPKMKHEPYAWENAGYDGD